MKHVIGYARESTIDQAHNGFNLDDQVRRITEYVDVMYDPDTCQLTMMREEGVSAKTLNRPQMNALLKKAENREFDTLIVYCLDRLTRNVRDLNVLLEFFEKYDIELISISEKIDTDSANGKMLINIIVLVAQWELDTLSSRSMRGVIESANQGNYSIGNVPVGYRRIKTEDHRKLLEIVPEEAEVVSMIFREIAADHESNYTIAKKLREHHVLNRSWVESTIENLIKNKLYMGVLEWKGISNDHFCEPIVEKELWEQANYVISHKNYNYHEYIFGDKVQCSSCHAMMQHTCTLKKKTGKVYLYYKCPKCGKTISEDKLYRKVYPYLFEIYKGLYRVDEITRMETEQKDAEYEIRMISAIAETRGLQKSSELYAEFRNNYSVYEDRIKKLAEIEQEKKELTASDISDETEQYILKQCIGSIIYDFKDKQCSVTVNREPEIAYEE